ncbi:MAG: hypothetical protein ACTSQE_07145 [Candidatus Heimdallarchaeaceae archaeon]
MSGQEDFTRCPSCGNLNIRGSEKCLFCDTELEVSEEDLELEIETFPCPSCTTDLPTSVTSCPICGWRKGGKEIEEPTDRGVDLGIPQVSDSATTPKTPFVPSVPETEEKETPAMPAILMEQELESESLDVEIVEEELDISKKGLTTLKFVFVFIFSALGLSSIHYGINFAIALATVKIIDPNVELLPFSENLGDKITITGLSFYCVIPLTIMIGYFASLVIRIKFKEIKDIIFWIGIFIFVDMIVHIVFPLVLTLAIRPREIMFSKIAGASLIFLVSNMILLFMPFLIGGHWLFQKIDKIYFPKKYAIN